MLRIAIVEDNPDELAVLVRALNSYSSARNEEFKITHFPSGESFLEGYSKGFDLVFLDIALTGLSGMQTAESLRKIDNDITLIFVTNLAQFAVKGYEVNAYDFIVKPVNYPDLEFKMDRLMERLRQRHEKKILIKTGSQHVAILVSDIRYVEIQGHKIVYHTTRGDYETYGVLRKLEDDLEGESFYKCNSCYLVNLRYVDSVQGYEAYLGSTCLVVSHPRRKGFVKALNEYFQKGN
jgi:DNA-binding LytR/AlgR family response regulator